MKDKTTDLIEFFLKNDQGASEELIIILNKIVQCGLTISSHVKKSGLSDAALSTGETNVHEDEVIKLDRFANDLITDTLSEEASVFGLGSEEIADFQEVNKNATYVVFFDPLDGSSNTEANIPIGTIFSAYKKPVEGFLQRGKEQVAAGYFLYGPSVMLVFSIGNGAHGFTLDPASGVFLLSHENIRIPEKGKIYSINEAKSSLWDDRTKTFINQLKSDNSYSLRYVGSMVADVHRTLIKGGVFLYPKDSQSPKGKLRLLFEVNPMSFLVHQAGGVCESEGVDPLGILPGSLHEKSPIVLGSPHEVKIYKNL